MPRISKNYAAKKSRKSGENFGHRLLGWQGYIFAQRASARVLLWFSGSALAQCERSRVRVPPLELMLFRVVILRVFIECVRRLFQNFRAPAKKRRKSRAVFPQKKILAGIDAARIFFPASFSPQTRCFYAVEERSARERVIRREIIHCRKFTTLANFVVKPCFW